MLTPINQFWRYASGIKYFHYGKSLKLDASITTTMSMDRTNRIFQRCDELSPVAYEFRP
jgi:hypothetical protein